MGFFFLVVEGEALFKRQLNPSNTVKKKKGRKGGRVHLGACFPPSEVCGVCSPFPRPDASCPFDLFIKEQKNPNEMHETLTGPLFHR